MEHVDASQAGNMQLSSWQRTFCLNTLTITTAQAGPGVVHCKELKSECKPGAYHQQQLTAAAELFHCCAWQFKAFMSS